MYVFIKQPVTCIAHGYEVHLIADAVSSRHEFDHQYGHCPHA